MKNPQAFPQFSFTVDGHPHEPGMTLRDHFAGLAMQAYSSDAVWRRTATPKETAASSYLIADAMLAEREK